MSSVSGVSVAGGVRVWWWRACVVWAVVVAVMFCLGSGVAGAASAGWLVGSEAVPTSVRPGSTELLIVHVANVGAAATDGAPVVVTDTLPAGMEAVEAGDVYNVQGKLDTQSAPVTVCVKVTETGGKFSGRFTNSGCTIESGSGEGEYESEVVPPRWLCSGRTVVTCENNPAAQRLIEPTDGYKNDGTLETALEAPEIGIRATVPASDTGKSENEVQVFGGGAPWPAVARQPVTVSSAPPGFGVANLSVSSYNEDGSTDTQAGSHPYGLLVNIELNSELSPAPEENLFAAGDTKTFEVQAPAGLVGDPQAVTECTREQFDGAGDHGESPECPVSSQIGIVVASLGDLSQPIPDYVYLPVYNLVPPPGVPAEFGFSETGIYGTIDASVRTGGDYGLTETVKDAPQRQVMGSAVTLWGEPSNPRHDSERIDESETCGKTRPRTCASGLARLPFLSNPGACGSTLLWTLSVDDWLEPEVFSRESAFTTDNLDNPATVTGCELQEFTPSVTVNPEEARTDRPTGAEVDVHVPQHYNNPEALAEATAKSIVVKLPAGLQVSPSAADGLQACSEAQIGLANATEPSCPEGSMIGTVESTTPLLKEPLGGAVYLAAQDANPFGSLLAIYIVIEGDGVLVKLAGHIEANPQTGQLTTTVSDLPDLPFEDAKIKLFGGPRAALMTPQTCGGYTAEGVLSPWSDTPAVTTDSTFQISTGCDSSFAPSFTAGSTSAAAGAFTSVTTTVAREDEERDIQGLSVTLPEGLLGVLKSVTQCGEPQAAEGACGAASEIGSATVAAGPGSDPYWLTGKVYLTGPYEGAPFGLDVVVPAVAGPFNLGNVTVRAKITINPATAQITVTSDPLPQFVNSTGIPTDVRTINVTVNRPGFTFNPTNCTTKQAAATIVSTAGQISTPTSSFQVANCSKLPFKPGFAVSTNGKTSKANGASLTVKVTSSPGQANIQKVHVTLPIQLPSRLSTLQKACLAAVFAANPASCPEGSNVGTATATTPLLAHPLTGPAYLVSHGAAEFPDLEIVLQGEGITLILDGKTDIKHEITTSTFNTVPDAPITTFTLNLPEGPHSALAANGNLCTTKLTLPTTITAQNGATTTKQTKITTTNCPKHKTSNKTKKKNKKSKKK